MAAQMIRAGIEKGWITAFHDESDGGLAVTLAERRAAHEGFFRG